MLKLTLLAMLSSVRALVRSPLPRSTARSFHRGAPLRMGLEKLEGLRNVAIVAHVDHGKTTLVDAMLKEAEVFRANEAVEERVMDSNDQERERGITILAKNAAVEYKGVKINVVDTPGHADFGGEVERILNMVDGVLLVVDSVEGPKPQTRFVLKKALELGLQAVLVVNKIDRPSARPDYVVDKAFDLFVELDANDEQTDFSIVYASALQGKSGVEPDDLQDNMAPILDAIIESIPPPMVDKEAPAQLLVANIDFDDFKGKLGIGRVRSGVLKAGDAGTFGAMSLYGYTTKQDLTSWGSFLFMGLIGIIIASLVNLFLASSALQFIVSVVGVLVFAGLTAWDTQRLKNDYIYGYASAGGDIAERAAISGALSLYLNFINLFTLLLQLLGQRD